MDCRLLEGENHAPLTAAKVKALAGHRIEYLRDSDIDKSGRGYIFPRTGLVLGSHHRNVEMDYECNYVSMSSLVEVVDLGVPKK